MARSLRVRRSNSQSDKKEPWRSFGIVTSTVLTRVSSSRWRHCWRRLVRTRSIQYPHAPQ